MAPSKFGVPGSRLSDDDLGRQLRQLHQTREETFFNGSANALRTHTDRMLDLEHEFAARFPDDTEPHPLRTRRGARAITP